MAQRNFSIKPHAEANVFTKIYTSPWQPEFGRWAFNYSRHVNRFDLAPCNFTFDPHGPPTDPIPKDPTAHPINPIPTHGIDIMMTHGPPYMHLDKVGGGDRAGCQHLLKAIARSRPRLHVFGHIHEGWGGERVSWPTEGGERAVNSTETMANPKLQESAEHDKHVVESTEAIAVDMSAAKRGRAAFLDISDQSERPLRYRQETVMLNASIMSVRYDPINPPWLLDLDLPALESMAAAEEEKHKLA